MADGLAVRGATFTAAVEMVVEECCNCGMAFAMPREFKNDRLKRRRNDMSFYCPRGHAQHYTGESEEVKLRRERDQLKQREAYLEDMRREAEQRAEHERNRANGYKGHATRITKRAKAGVCPCCNRSFENLRRHMADQHPQFTPMELENKVASSA